MVFAVMHPEHHRDPRVFADYLDRRGRALDDHDQVDAFQAGEVDPITHQYLNPGPFQRRPEPVGWAGRSGAEAEGDPSSPVPSGGYLAGVLQPGLSLRDGSRRRHRKLGLSRSGPDQIPVGTGPVGAARHPGVQALGHAVGGAGHP